MIFDPRYSSLLGDVRFVQDLNMVESKEDWSKVRSPSRALRRMMRGHRQNIRTLLVPRKDAITAMAAARITFIPNCIDRLCTK